MHTLQPMKLIASLAVTVVLALPNPQDAPPLNRLPNVKTLDAPRPISPNSFNPFSSLNQFKSAGKGFGKQGPKKAANQGGRAARGKGSLKGSSASGGSGGPKDPSGPKGSSSDNEDESEIDEECMTCIERCINGKPYRNTILPAEIDFMHSYPIMDLGMQCATLCSVMLISLGYGPDVDCMKPVLAVARALEEEEEEEGGNGAPSRPDLSFEEQRLRKEESAVFGMRAGSARQAGTWENAKVGAASLVGAGVVLLGAVFRGLLRQVRPGFAGG